MSGSAAAEGPSRPAPRRARREVAARRGVGGRVLAGCAVGCLAGLVVGLLLRLSGPTDGPAVTLLLTLGPPATRLVLDAAGVATVGLTLFPLLAQHARARTAAPALATACRAGVVSGAVWAATAGLLLWLEVAEATSLSPFEVPAERVTGYLGAAVAGRALVVTVVCGLAVAVASALAAYRPHRVPAGLTPVPALLGVIALPVTGHAATADVRSLAVMAVAVHVAAACAWLGGLAAVTWLAGTRRELLAATLPRYSRLATGCLVLVAATGVLGALLRLPSPVVLVTSPYGWILLGKASGLLLLGALGARARARLIPAAAARKAGSLAGWLLAELVVMGVVLGLASVLAGTAPT